MVEDTDMAKAREWFGKLLARPESLPVSFRLDGRTIAGLPEEWSLVTKRRRVDASIHETTFEATDPRDGIVRQRRGDAVLRLPGLRVGGLVHQHG